MNEFLVAWLVLASVNFVATISPGPAFALTVRNAIAYDRRAGIMTAIGLGLGIAGMVTIVLGGFAAIISQSVLIFNIIKYVGAAYLVYIGAKALMAKKPAIVNAAEEHISAVRKISDLAALRMGYLTNQFNPKGLVFFSAVFAQFISPGTPWQVLVLYGLTSVMIEILWFGTVAFILTNPLIKQRFMGISHWIERVCGGLLIALGVRLAWK